MEHEGIMGLIREVYPVSFIMIILISFGYILSQIVHVPEIKFLEKLIAGKDNGGTE